MGGAGSDMLGEVNSKAGSKCCWEASVGCYMSKNRDTLSCT